LQALFVIHRDLKLKNILVNDGILKIADFGLSKMGELGVTHVGTPYTKAPEVYKGRGRINYNNKADIWSLGVIFY
jgi:serine/threonine protein kinase